MASRTTVTAPGRIILGLMVFTMTFALVGGELEQGAGKAQTISPFTIIFGGTVATSLLTLLSHAGETGEHLAVGLATVAFLTTALTYGKPGGEVWDKLAETVGGKPTTPSKATAPTKPTTGTVQTATALTAVAG